MSISKDYFNLSRFLSIILAIIPITSWILGVLTRFKEGALLAGVLRLLLGWNIIWIIDMLLIIFSGKIMRLINF